MRRHSSDWPLVAGVLVSAVLHGGVVWTSLQASERGWLEDNAPFPRQTPARLAYEPEPLPPPTPEEQERERAIRLGIADSTAETDTWIGVKPEDAGDVHGPRSTVEQAAYAPPAGAPDLPLISQPTPDLPPSPADPAPPAPQTPDVERPTDQAPIGAPPAPMTESTEPAADPTEVNRALEESTLPEADEKVEEIEPEDFTPLSDVPVAVPGAPRPAQTQDPLTFEVSRPDDAPDGVPPAPTQPSPALVQPPGGVTDQQSQGEVSDRESEAAAIRDAIEVIPGKPAAGKGLEIKTIRPRWSHFTLLTANPRDAIVRVSFNRFGKVSDVEFLRSTGRDDVDRPLKDAIYNWTATGKELEALAPPVEGQAAETVELVFRLILRS